MNRASNRCVVLKVGGSLGGDSGPAVIEAISRVINDERTVVIVHGGGQRISSALAGAGMESTFLNGQRVTSAAAMVIVEQVLAVSVNGEIVDALRANQLPGVGLSGAADILYCTPIPELGRAARVRYVQPAAIVETLARNEVPVVAPVGRDEAGLHYNVNADLAAAAIAGAMAAERIVFLTDVAGIYADFSAGQLLTDTTDEVLRLLMGEGSFAAGMIPKVESVLAALDAGVSNAYVVNGRDLDSVLWAVGGQTPDHEPEAWSSTSRSGTRVTRATSSAQVS